MNHYFYIQLVHFTDGEVFIINGAGFETAQERKSNWESIPALEPEFGATANFRVEMLDRNEQIIAEKDITRKTAIALIGSEKELEESIEKAKTELRDFLSARL